MAIKKLTPKNVHAKIKSGSVIRTKEMDEDESLLRDTNGYMYITFLQTILAFLMQDAPEALTQVSHFIIFELTLSGARFHNRGIRPYCQTFQN